MNYALLEGKLARQETVFLDGAIWTELQRRGAPLHPLIGGAMATITNPDILRRVHEEYIRAGCDLITTNTFSSSRNLLGPLGLGAEVAPLTRGAVEIALRARERTSGIKQVAIGGAMSAALPLLEGTARHDPQLRPSAQEMQLNFHETADLLARAGADLILLEMMCEIEITQWAVAAALQTRLPVWVGIPAVESWDGELLCDLDFEVPFEEMAGEVAEMGVSACGVMHTPLNLVAPAIDVLQQYWSGPLFAYPESGRKRRGEWEFDQSLSAARFARACGEWRDAGAHMLGGCCGITLGHIQAMVGGLRGR